MSAAPLEIAAAVEGDVDEAVLRRITEHVGIGVRSVYGKRGKAHLKEHIRSYNNAARFVPWVALVDLDQDADCAPPFRSEWLPRPTEHMCFRIAVREVESWLLGDSERLASLLAVPVSRVPRTPESVADPKQTIVNLARRSRRRGVREDMVPNPRSGRAVGPLYTSNLIRFVSDARDGWRPDVALTACDSLARCIRQLQDLVANQVRGAG